ncbi:hypothetical protein ACOMHN_056039 [Nucella lapillus]
MIAARKDSGPSRLKVVVVGDGDCGKTCLLHHFSTGKFIARHVPTAFEVQSKIVHHNHQQVELILHDTAGQGAYDRLRHFAYRRTHVLLLCFALDDPRSLHHVLLHWLPELRHHCPNVPVLLVATKKDTRASTSHLYPTLSPPGGGDSDRVPLPCRAVTYQEGLGVARKADAVGYYETSAKSGEGVEAVFEAAVQLFQEDGLRKSTGLFRYRDSSSRSAA